MVIETENFGNIDIDENKIYTFDNGLPGFEKLKKFVIVEKDASDSNSVFRWLQSTEDPKTAFIMMDVYKIIPDYNPLVYDDDLNSLGEISDDSLLIYNIVVIPKIVSKMSVNLKAPVVINLLTNKGMQMITKNEDYPIKYYFYEELKKKNGGE